MFKKKICFLFGAGAEGKCQYGMPNGSEFKKDVIYAKGIKNLFYSINNTAQLNITEGSLLSCNQTSVLYQTLKENDNNVAKELYKLDPKYKKVVEEYLKHKSSKNDDKYKPDKFKEIYRKEIYDKLNNKDQKEIKNDSFLDCFLKNASLYSYIDSNFNFLRKPDEYINEVSKVVKLYFSAFYSIYKVIDDSDINSLNRDHINKAIKKYYANELNEQNTYYAQIKHLKDAMDVNVITTNYTKIAQKVIDTNDVAYLHGRLDLFENLYTKEIKEISKFASNETIFPFLLVPSGVKPIVNPVQINEYKKAYNYLENADYIVILGYGLNTDDEHITTMLNYYLKDGKKKIYYFIYDDFENNKRKVKKMLNIENIAFKEMCEFNSFINEMVGDGNEIC